MPGLMGFNDFGGARLLEIGCGLGTDLLQFARGGAEVTAIDLTARSVEASRQHLRLYGCDGDFAISDAERLPFANESFDVVYSNGVLHHTPDTHLAVSEIHRVLKSGGLARVMLYHRHSINYWTHIILLEGLLRAKFIRGFSTADILSHRAEFNESGGRPLVKVYSRKEARQLFANFREVTIQIAQLTRGELFPLGRIMPESTFAYLSRAVGWNVIISARK